MMNKKIIQLFIITFFVFLTLPSLVLAFDMDISVAPTEKLSFNCGGQESVTVSLTNKGNYYGALCWWSLDKSSWTKGTNSCLSPEGGTGTFSINLNVPNTGFTTHTVYVACRNYGHTEWIVYHYNDCFDTISWTNESYYEGYTKTTNCLINSQQDADCVYQGNVKLECSSLKQVAEAEINTAKNLISDAQSAINSAQSKIQEASKIGADVIQANSYLSSANTALNNAQTYLSSAQTSYNTGIYESAKNSAQQAQTYANNAKTYANQAKSSAEQAMQQVSQEKIDAANAKSSAYSAIDTAKKAIKEAEGLINNATIIGMDTTQAEGDVATARSKLKSAEDYYSEATSAFDAANYALTKQKATSAGSYAKDAESLATSAYNSLWVVYSQKRVAAEAITNADSEVSQMNEINTKMTYILRNMKTYGVDTTETKTVADEAKTNTDTAEDLLSQAKNRLNAGYTSEAADLAVQARDKAAASHNRLDTVVLNLKFGIQDALEAAYNQKQTNLKQAKSEVQSAGQTYGADNELIIKAQEEVSSAETALNDAKSKMDAVETSESLTNLLTNAKAAFEGLDTAQQQIGMAKADASAAGMGLYQTIAIGGAAIAAVGGGFLYWRRKRKKGEKAEKETEERKKPDQCSKCGAKLSKKHKFCPKCGTKV